MSILSIIYQKKPIPVHGLQLFVSHFSLDNLAYDVGVLILSTSFSHCVFRRFSQQAITCSPSFFFLNFYCFFPSYATDVLATHRDGLFQLHQLLDTQSIPPIIALSNVCGHLCNCRLIACRLVFQKALNNCTKQVISLAKSYFSSMS